MRRETWDQGSQTFDENTENISNTQAQLCLKTRYSLQGEADSTYCSHYYVFFQLEFCKYCLTSHTYEAVAKNETARKQPLRHPSIHPSLTTAILNAIAIDNEACKKKLHMASPNSIPSEHSIRPLPQGTPPF